MMRKKHIALFSQSNFWELLIIVIGAVSWSLTMIKSGLMYSFGMGFWGANGHDGVWHIALAESLARGSLDMPVFAGEQLKNYHIGFDLALAILHKVSGIPITVLYFQIIPPIVAVSIGLVARKVVFAWTKDRMAVAWSLFFIYFAGNFGWIVSLVKDKTIGGESAFWSQQAISTLINPPFAVSLLVLLLGLYFLSVPTKRNSIIATILFGIVVQIKAYAGVLILGALWISGIYELGKKRKNILFVAMGSTAVGVLAFLPFNTQSPGLLVWQPLWFLETMMGLTDRVGWLRFYSAMTNYRSGGNIPKGVAAYAVAFIIFWWGNLGTRVVKEVLVVSWLTRIKKLMWYEVLMASVVVSGVAIPMLFLQKGTPWNTIQFLYYALFFSNIMTGIALSTLLNKRSRGIKWAAGTIVVLLTIPTTASSLWYHYIPSRPPAMVSHAELDALRFLSQKPEGVVLTYPYTRTDYNAPVPLSRYVSTAYVAAFSKKPVYLEDEVNLNITGYAWNTRRDEVLSFYASNDQDMVRAFLAKNNIAYVYWLKGQRALLGESQLGLERIYENNEVDIYSVMP